MNGNQPNKHTELVPNDDLVEVGSLIRKWRENINMTQLELSEKAGLGEKTISRLELGKNMKLMTFFTLAEALSVSPNELSPARFSECAKDTEIDLLKIKLHSLNSKQKAMVLGIMHSIIDNIIQYN